MIRIIGNKTTALPPELGGERYDLVRAKEHVKTRLKPDGKHELVWAGSDELLTLAVVKKIVDSGSDVLGYPVFFKFLDPLLPCPFAELKKDLDGKSLPLENWHEWGVVGKSHKPVKLGGDWYRSNNVGASGEPLPASKWITPPTGVTLVTVDQFRTIPRPDSTP